MQTKKKGRWANHNFFLVKQKEHYIWVLAGPNLPSGDHKYYHLSITTQLIKSQRNKRESKHFWTQIAEKMNKIVSLLKLLSRSYTTTTTNANLHYSNRLRGKPALSNMSCPSRPSHQSSCILAHAWVQITSEVVTTSSFKSFWCKLTKKHG